MTDQTTKKKRRHITDLHKTVKRRSTGTFDRAHFVISLEPGDVIGFRRERSRKIFRITLAACYAMAVKAEVAAAKAAKMAAKKERKS